VEVVISLLMSFTPHPRDVADPWYTGDFERSWKDILEGCKGLLAEINEG
jgi:protein-tyrosine phosphatase